MRIRLATLTIFWIFNGFGQDTNAYPNPLSLLRFRPSIRASYEPHRGLEMNRVNFEIGVNDKNRLFIFFGTGYETTLFPKYEGMRFDFFTNSLALDIRILKSKYLCSPMLHFDFGWAYKSDSVAVRDDMKPTIYADFNSNYVGYFNKVDHFGSVQLKFDFFVRPMHFQIGVGYRSQSYSYYSAFQDWTLIKETWAGLILSASLVYDFKWSNKSVK